MTVTTDELRYWVFNRQVIDSNTSTAVREFTTKTAARRAARQLNRSTP